LIKGLAEYERMADEVVADEALLGKWLFEERKAEVVIGEAGGDAVGFALFFSNFSTFLGRPGIYLEDLFVIPKARGNGYGKLLLQHLAKLVVDRGYGRLEWSCLDWNKPSINFYLSLGAVPMDDWTVYRMTGDALRTLA
jgi:GNAT superfamily N-acetyltransferase